MSDEFAKRAFDRFSQMDEARSSTGSGLGLAIVQQIVSHHHGKVWVDQECRKNNTGCTIRFWFPITSEFSNSNTDHNNKTEN